MKTSSRLLMCLLGFLILGKSQGNGSQTNVPDFFNREAACLNEFYYQPCRNYTGFISCLDELRNLNLSDYQERYVSDEISRKMEERERSCRALDDKGTCIEREVANCSILMKRNEYYSFYHRDCKSIESVIHCIDDLLDVCNNSYQYWAVSEKGWYEKDLGEYCDRSDAERKCIDDMEACDQMVDYLTNSSTCQNTRAAHACLDKVESDSTCSNATAREIRVHRISIENDEERCELSSGQCTWDHIHNCTYIVYYSRAYCSPSSTKAASKCMAELKPKCTTKTQKRVFDEENGYLSDACRNFGPHSTTPLWDANQTTV